MSGRRKHMEKAPRRQQAAVVVFDKPHFLFDRESDLPQFGQHQLCVTPYEGHLADLKLAEWEPHAAKPVLASIDMSDLQLEPLA